MLFLFLSIVNFFDDLLNSFFLFSDFIKGFIIFLSTLFAGKILCVEKSIFVNSCINLTKINYFFYYFFYYYY